MALTPIPIHVYPLDVQVRTGAGAAQFAAILYGNGWIYVSGFGCVKPVKYGMLVNNSGVITVAGVNQTPFGADPNNSALIPGNGAIAALIAPWLNLTTYNAIVANMTFHSLNFVGG